MQRRDDLGGVLQRADVVELEVQRPASARSLCRPNVRGALPRPTTGATRSGLAWPQSLQPVQQLARVADGGRQPDPLQRPPGEPGEPLQDARAGASPGRRAAKACTSSTTTARRSANKRRWSTFGADEHRFQRLGRGQQQVGRVGAGSPCAARPGRRRARGRPGGRPAAVDLQPRCRLLSSALSGHRYRTARPPQPSAAIRVRSGKKAASVLPPAVGASSSASSPRSTGSMASPCSGRSVASRGW